MAAVFLKLLNMSISATWLVLAVVLARLLLKKAPKWVHCLLWGIVGLRLVWPFRIESILSLIPSTETVPEQIGAAVPQINTGIPVINNAVNPVIEEVFAGTPAVSAVSPMQIAAIVWVVGMTAMLVYAAVTYLRIRCQVREAVQQGNMWLCDRIDTPFILGVVHPRIYIPSVIDRQDIPFVLAHENAHLQRLDHLWKPLGFVLLAVYWMNPAMWLAYVLLCRDIEFACDEKVLKQQGSEIKKSYSTALINCSIPRRMISACPVAFGEVGVKSRVQSVLNYKKPTCWIILAALITCAVLAVCFLTDPMKDAKTVTTKQVQYYAYITGDVDLLLEKDGEHYLLWNARTHAPAYTGTYSEKEGLLTLRTEGEDLLLKRSTETSHLTAVSGCSFGDITICKNDILQTWQRRDTDDPHYYDCDYDIDNDGVLEMFGTGFSRIGPLDSGSKICSVGCSKNGENMFSVYLKGTFDEYFMTLADGVYLCQVDENTMVRMTHLTEEYMIKNDPRRGIVLNDAALMRPVREITGVGTTAEGVEVKVVQMYPCTGGISCELVLYNKSAKPLLYDASLPTTLEYDGHRTQYKADIFLTQNTFELMPGQSIRLRYSLQIGDDVLKEGKYILRKEFIHDGLQRDLLVEMTLNQDVSILADESPVAPAKPQIENVRVEESRSKSGISLAEATDGGVCLSSWLKMNDGEEIPAPYFADTLIRSFFYVG